MRTPPLVRRSGVVAAVAFAALIAIAASPRQEPTTAAALDRYSRGEHLAAIQAIDGRDFGVTFDRLTSEADAWTKAGDASDGPRRRMVAAAFALDTMWSQARWASLPDGNAPGFAGRSPRRSDAALVVIAWGCQLSKPSPASPAERWWYRATVAMLEAHGDWDVLEGHGGPKADSLLLSAGVGREYTGGHLSHAKTRFPDEPRWRLEPLFKAEQAADTWLRQPRTNAGGVGALRHDELSARQIADAVSRSFVALDRKLTDLDRELTALAADPDPSLRAEAVLHRAYWRIWYRDWATALEDLGRLSDPALDPYQRYMAAYFTGWAYQRLDRRADAIAAYRRAAAILPDGGSLSTLLAAQLFLDGQRAEAHVLLDSVFSTSPTALDPWLLFKQGDARLIDNAILRMREALR